MGTPVPPIQLPLTEEQQALLQRLSGQYAQVLELVPDPTDGASGVGQRPSLSLAALGCDGHPAPAVGLWGRVSPDGSRGRFVNGGRLVKGLSGLEHADELSRVGVAGCRLSWRPGADKESRTPAE